MWKHRYPRTSLSSWDSPLHSTRFANLFPLQTSHSNLLLRVWSSLPCPGCCVHESPHRAHPAVQRQDPKQNPNPHITGVGISIEEESVEGWTPGLLHNGGLYTDSPFVVQGLKSQLSLTLDNRYKPGTSVSPSANQQNQQAGGGGLGPTRAPVSSTSSSHGGLRRPQTEEARPGAAGTGKPGPAGGARETEAHAAEFGRSRAAESSAI